MKTKNKMRGIATAAIVASCYIILTFLSSSLGLASGAVQIRLSEALTVLPVFTPYAIPGLFAGCFLANILTGCALWDIILGSFATLTGAVFTYFLRKKSVLSLAPPIISNTITIPIVLTFFYSLQGAYWYFVITVFIGEFISCGVLGYFLRKSINKRNIFNKI